MWLLILALILILTVLGFIFPRIEYEVNIFRKARFDHLNSRGTIHKKLIKKGLVKIDLEIKEAKRRLQQLNLEKSNMALEENRELENTLSTIIVNTELDDVPGIGPVLKERIIRSCFDGTIESLRRAGNVRGIGEEKYHAILHWVNTKSSLMPQLLRKDFPGKNEIIRKYSESEKNIVRELEKVGQELKEMTELRELSNAELAKLKPVSTFAFLKAYKGDREAAEKVTQYLLGAFPEWSKIPEWFETLMTKYGTA
jgi:hypothetical protein